MQQYIPSTTPMGSPHYAHNDPWAHALICCDHDHGASTSSPNQNHPMNQSIPQQQQQQQQSFNRNPGFYDQTPPNGFSANQSINQLQPQPGKCIECAAECPLEAYCCGGDYCCDGSHGCEKSEERCVDPTCEEVSKEPCHEDHPFHPQGQCGDHPNETHNHYHEDSMKSLEEWADTKEGCHAIQQLLECCNQPDCNIPVCPTENETIHPPPQDPLAAIFGSMVAQPIEPSPITDAGPSSTIEAMSHTCHWGNCHLVFKSMPDLLAHVAADHLSAWGSGSGPKPGEPAQQTTPTVPPPQMTNNNLATNNNFMTTPPLQMSNTGTMSVNTTFQTPQQAAETDQLLSCLWDDCFPMADLPTGLSETFPQNTSTSQFPQMHQIPHAHAQQAHNHSHDHTTATGEPFSPGTMLRHVLEEHLGVPGAIIGWPNEAQLSQQGGQQSLDKNHHHHHVDPHHLAHHHDHSHIGPNHTHNHMPTTHDHPHPHHHHTHNNSHDFSHNHHSHPFPTPPSTVNTQLSTSPAPIPSQSSSNTTLNTLSGLHVGCNANAAGNQLICLWPECPLSDHIFPDSASLMDHLSEVHIPKGKDSYVCHWDNCGDGEGRIFKSRQKVLRHLQSHTGHKPFVCGVCDQAFSEAAPLSAHMRRHAQQKPFKCDYPGCGKTFAVSSSLTIHMRTHNGEKPYICPHCGRGFVEASNLTKHIRTHTGERPFSCAHPGCGKKFSRPDQLKRHMLVHDKPLNGTGPNQGHARRRSSVQVERANTTNTRDEPPSLSATSSSSESNSDSGNGSGSQSQYGGHSNTIVGRA